MNIIIEYDLSKKSAVQKTRIIRAMFGFKDKSNFGKYAYERKGLITKIPNTRQIKGILTNNAHKTEVFQILKKLKTKPKIIKMTKTK